MFTVDALQWLGCITGVFGALLLALKIKHSGWGFVLFLVSNGFWIAFAIETSANGLLVMQLAFSITSAIGIFNWLVDDKQVRQYG